MKKEATLNRLHQLSNDSLITDLKDLVTQEREMLLEILQYLKEVENRQLYLKMGYPSLFAFLTESLGYSEGAAQRRIQAMRLMKELPEVGPKIESGEISLSVASQVQGFIQREDKKRKTEKTPLLKPTEKLQLLNQLEGTSSRECERQLVKISPEAAMPTEKTKPLSETKTMIQFVAGSDLMNKIQRLKSLTSHTNPEGKYEVLFKKLSELALDKLDPERRAERRAKRAQQTQIKNSPQNPNPSSENFPHTDHLKAPKKSPIIKSSPRTGAPCGARVLGGSPLAKESDPPPNPRPQRQALSLPPTSAVKTLSRVELLKKLQSSDSSAAPKVTNESNQAKPLKNTRNQVSPPASAVLRSRHISNKLKDQIYRRDQGKCQYRDLRTQKSCLSTYQIQLEHRYPYSLGGEHAEKNLRLYCNKHNRYRAWEINSC